MGGQVSEVSESTTRVLLEVATWNGVNILRTSRKLGLRSEASNRFEKQLHPELAIRAPADRLAADGRGLRREARPRDDRRRRRDPRRRTGSALRAGRAEALLGMAVDARRRRASTSSGSSSTSSADGDDLDGDGARRTATTTSPARST